MKGKKKQFEKDKLFLNGEKLMKSYKNRLQFMFQHAIICSIKNHV